MQTTYKPTADDVKRLRDETGAGMIDCRNALVKSEGDAGKAKLLLQEQGQAKAEKKAERSANEGLVGSYIHTGGKVGVLVEINCETDFVARNEVFQQFVKDVAMHIAASAPLFLKREDVPSDVVEKEKAIYREQLREQGKPEKVWDKILEGKLDKFYKDVCLVDQPFVKDPDKSVQQLTVDMVAKIGENIQIRRFTRYQLGEGQTAAK
jgi:elongation factor Ts